ncbi:MAG: hypothetical protein R3E89_15050 [Thiolinea sp.]
MQPVHNGQRLCWTYPPHLYDDTAIHPHTKPGRGVSAHALRPVAAAVDHGPVQAEAVASLQELTQNLRIDPANITVSGLSSGAFMAVQLHVSHSARIRGAAVIAGGPYRCTAGRYPGSWF